MFGDNIKIGKATTEEEMLEEISDFTKMIDGLKEALGKANGLTTKLKPEEVFYISSFIAFISDSVKGINADNIGKMYPAYCKILAPMSVSCVLLSVAPDLSEVMMDSFAKVLDKLFFVSLISSLTNGIEK